MTTEWNPAALISPHQPSLDPPYALLVLNQPLLNLEVLKQVWKKSGYRIAADGGANQLHVTLENREIADLAKQIKLQVLCGDLDSINDSAMCWARKQGTIISKDPDEYSTDFTKCFKYIRRHYQRSCDIVCMGGLGGRVDQGIATLNHLYMFQQDYSDGKVYLLSTEAITFVLKVGTHRIRVRGPEEPSILGKNVGIIPMKQPCHITTSGLTWDVTDWKTEFGGQISTSNYVREDYVTVATDGDVLFTIDINLPPQ
ncbi:MAG: hypothetical protein M1818_007072 [Claussenomyces sp. TS43310]|nr:MAG: hypothetical protein M1818_007072 [Claussenomyces sp. TS43310]